MGDTLREEFAGLCHEQWSGWMRYLYSKCQSNGDGSLVIPPWAVARWARQMVTDYGDLSESEKESDRKEADRFLSLMRSATGNPEWCNKGEPCTYAKMFCLPGCGGCTHDLRDVE